MLNLSDKTWTNVFLAIRFRNKINHAYFVSPSVVLNLDCFQLIVKLWTTLNKFLLFHRFYFLTSTQVQMQAFLHPTLWALYNKAVMTLIQVIFHPILVLYYWTILSKLYSIWTVYYGVIHLKTDQFQVNTVLLWDGERTIRISLF